tara:strand:- start:83 stop:286 length:204 start_codon:yes stop_codon:yes gene_type:complete
MSTEKKSRTINEYRQVKDSVYHHPHKPKRENHLFKKLYLEINELCKSKGNDQELGGAVRRAIKKYYI